MSDDDTSPKVNDIIDRRGAAYGIRSTRRSSLGAGEQRTNATDWAAQYRRGADEAQSESDASR